MKTSILRKSLWVALLSWSTCAFGQTVTGSGQYGSIPFFSSSLYPERVYGSSLYFWGGKLGIGIINPNAPLQFLNSLGNRKIVLWENANNDHQFYGLGVKGGEFRFQIPVNNNATAFRFFSAIDASNSTEIFTALGNGNVGIGVNNPTGKLQVNGRLVIDNPGAGGPLGNGSLLSFSSGGSDVTAIQENWGLNLVGSDVRPVKVINTSLLVGYLSNNTNYAGNNVLVQGNIGVGTTSPENKLEVLGNVSLGKTNFSEAAAFLNPGYYVHKNGTTAYGMKLQYTQGEYGTMVFGPNQVNRFIGFGKVGSLLQDDRMVEYMRVDLDNGNVGIGTTTPHAPLQLNNAFAKRKLVLYEEGDNDHQFYGLGVEAGSAQFQVANASAAFRFFRGNNLSSSTEVFTIQGDGKVGVGNATPAFPLHVTGKIGSSGLVLESTTPAINTSAGAQFLHIYNDQSVANGLKAGGVLVADDYNYAGPGKNDLIVKGRIGVGTATPDPAYQLSVNGKVRAKEVKVNTGWSDYVFYDNYRLRPLAEVEQFIQANKHLPEVPSAREVEQNGINLGETDALLLKKIEELTLYLIELKKENQAQNQEIQLLKQRLSESGKQ